MSASFEQCIIVGNVGQDCELRYTQSGVPVASFSVAVSSSWTDKDTNEKRESTKWYRVTCWRKMAETMKQYVVKGMSVMVQGTCEASAFMGQDGEPRASLELTAREVQFLSHAGDNGQSDNDYAPPPEPDDSPSPKTGEETMTREAWNKVLMAETTSLYSDINTQKEILTKAYQNNEISMLMSPSEAAKVMRKKLDDIPF